MRGPLNSEKVWLLNATQDQQLPSTTCKLLWYVAKLKTN